MKHMIDIFWFAAAYNDLVLVGNKCNEGGVIITGKYSTAPSHVTCITVKIIQISF